MYKDLGNLKKGFHGPGPTLGVVSKLGTTYRGPLSDIVRRAPATGE